MLLEIENVFGGYGNGDILKGISCSADYGDVLCLLGPNGCGKTTLSVSYTHLTLPTKVLV